MKGEKFKGGAQRDNRMGKGRFDLISPFALSRIAAVYEKGAKFHGDRNWEKGIPFSRCLDSAFRHMIQYLMGKKDEDHLAQACWNLIAILHFEAIRPDLNDLPEYEKKLK
jgi:hypothetical protein